jgi:hypothetical protein
MIAMIEAAFRTGPMAAPCGADRSTAGRRATGRRAIRLAAVARGADREEAVAPPTRFLAKRRVHDVGAATRSDWTRTSHPWHNVSDWLGLSEHRGGHRGFGGISSRPSPHPPQPVSLPHSSPSPSRGRSAAAAPLHPDDRHRRRAPAGLFDRHPTLHNRSETTSGRHPSVDTSPDFYTSTWSATRERASP